jgi:hypothetical protein
LFYKTAGLIIYSWIRLKISVISRSLTTNGNYSRKKWIQFTKWSFEVERSWIPRGIFSSSKACGAKLD